LIASKVMWIPAMLGVPNRMLPTPTVRFWGSSLAELMVYVGNPSQKDWHSCPGHTDPDATVGACEKKTLLPGGLSGA
jgi:hypothetical protein